MRKSKKRTCKRKTATSTLKSKFGRDVEAPPNWADGRSYDELETPTDKVFESVNLDEALAALKKVTRPASARFLP